MKTQTHTDITINELILKKEQVIEDLYLRQIGKKLKNWDELSKLLGTSVEDEVKQISKEILLLKSQKTKPVEISKSSVLETGTITTTTEGHIVFNSLTNKERDEIVANVLKNNPTFKAAAVRSFIGASMNPGYIATYDDVFYSVQRVKSAK